MIRLVKFNKLEEKDLDKIIYKHYIHWKQYNDKLVGFCTLREDNLRERLEGLRERRGFLN